MNLQEMQQEDSCQSLESMRTSGRRKPMPILTKAESDVLKERHVERWALKACQSTSFIQCLKAFDIVQAITVITPNGKSIIISASHIYAARKRFFSGFVEQDLYNMTEVGDKLVE